MKIAVLVNDFGPPWNEGNKNFLRDLLSPLAQNHRFVFIGLSEKTGERTHELGTSFQYRSFLYWSEWCQFFYWQGYLNLFLKARRVIRSEQPDLVLVAWQPTLTILLARLLCWWARCKAPLVALVTTDWYTPRHAPLRVWLLEHLFNLLFNNELAFRVGLFFGDHFICTSRYLYERLGQRGYRNLSYIPVGVDVQRFQPGEGRHKLNRGHASLVVAYVGHLTHAKGCGLLVQAVLPLLEKFNIDVVLAVTVGSEEAFVKRLSAHPRIKRVGLTNPLEIYRAADVVVLPRRFSYGTTLYPLVLIEAMACGVPVLTSDLPEVREVIRHGENGFLFRANDVDDLRAKIEEAVRLKEKLPAIGQRAREEVVSCLDIRASTRQLEELIRGFRSAL